MESLVINLENDIAIVLIEVESSEMLRQVGDVFYLTALRGPHQPSVVVAAHGRLLRLWLI